MAKSHFDIAKAVLPYIPQYGRYDDALVLLETELAGNVASMYRRQLAQDLKDMEQHRPVSLLAKWLPSINTSSAQTRKYAGILCRYFHIFIDINIPHLQLSSILFIFFLYPL